MKTAPALFNYSKVADLEWRVSVRDDPSANVGVIGVDCEVTNVTEWYVVSDESNIDFPVGSRNYAPEIDTDNSSTAVIVGPYDTQPKAVRAAEVELVMMHYQKVMTAAQVAAKKAYDAYDGHWYPCGFANLVIKPARGRFATYLKEMCGASPAYGGGLSVSVYWLVSDGSSQSMEQKLAGVRAAVDVLKEHGVPCVAESRVD